MAFSSRSLVLVTGASRGFGKEVAQELVRQIASKQPVDVVLLARSRGGLQSTAEAIKMMQLEHKVVVQPESLDLSDLSTLEQNVGKIFAEIDPRRYSQAVLVNSAGAFGFIGPANELPSLMDLRSEIDFNVTSSIWLTSRFAKIFGVPGQEKRPVTTPRGIEPVATTKPAAAAAGTSNNQGVEGNGAFSKGNGNVVVNLTSGFALKPREFWCGYAASKAAREMYHRVLALEQEALGGLKVLNYSPGAMKTDMTFQVRDSGFCTVANSLISPNASAEKCARIALSNRFPNGAHINFNDKGYD